MQLEKWTRHTWISIYWCLSRSSWIILKLGWLPLFVEMVILTRNKHWTILFNACRLHFWRYFVFTSNQLAYNEVWKLDFYYRNGRKKLGLIPPSVKKILIGPRTIIESHCESWERSEKWLLRYLCVLVDHLFLAPQ